MRRPSITQNSNSNNNTGSSLPRVAGTVRIYSTCKNDTSDNLEFVKLKFGDVCSIYPVVLRDAHIRAARMVDVMDILVMILGYRIGFHFFWGFCFCFQGSRICGAAGGRNGCPLSYVRLFATSFHRHLLFFLPLRVRLVRWCRERVEAIFCRCGPRCTSCGDHFM
jgi:hypothetical protein